MDGKIFCIGLNKTGTTSLHLALEKLGFKSVHYEDDQGNNIKEIIQHNFEKGKNILEGLEEYDAFTDWDNSSNTVGIFKEFDRQYPNSKFILNTRDLESWLDSRERHVLKNQRFVKNNPESDLTWLEVDREGWTKHYLEHHKEALKYFQDRPKDLLVFDVINGDGWEKLCPFLGVPVPGHPFPKRNVSPQNKSPQRKFLLKIFRTLPWSLRQRIAKVLLD